MIFRRGGRVFTRVMELLICPSAVIVVVQVRPWAVGRLWLVLLVRLVLLVLLVPVPRLIRRRMVAPRPSPLLSGVHHWTSPAPWA